MGLEIGMSMKIKVKQLNIFIEDLFSVRLGTENRKCIPTNFLQTTNKKSTRYDVS